MFCSTCSAHAATLGIAPIHLKSEIFILTVCSRHVYHALLHSTTVVQASVFWVEKKKAYESKGPAAITVGLERVILHVRALLI